jgi:hypothetical protein
MDPGNARTVFVVVVDDSKDLTHAKTFGKLRGVFAHQRKPYNTYKMIEHARGVLNEWQSGDYLLLMGDPALCAVAMSLVLENDYKVNVLKWDRLLFEYIPECWDFGSVDSADDDLS